MKKSILTLAVIAGLASTAAYADGTTLYGTVKVRAEFTNKKANVEGVTSAINSVKNSNFHIKQDSNFGIRGSESLGSGLEAFYNIKVSVNSSNDDKIEIKGDKAYVGIRGGFGALSLGTQDGVYEWAGDTVGGFNGSRDATDFFFGPGDLSNSIAYVSPSFGGVQFGLAAVADGSMYGEDSGKYNKDDAAVKNSYVKAGDEKEATAVRPHNTGKKVDAYQAAVKFNAFGAKAALAYATTNGLKGGVKTVKDKKGNLVKKDIYETQSIALALGYELSNKFNIDFGVEKELTKKSNKKVAYGLAGTYDISDSDDVHFGLGYLDKNDDDADNQKSYGIGYTHKFSKRTKTWIEYVYEDLGEKTHDQALQLGLSTSF